MHLWKKLLAATALTVALLGLAPAGLASAATSDVPAASAHPAVSLVNTADADKNSWKDVGCGSGEDVNCLPYKRWMPATQAFHGRFDGFGGMAATSYQVQAGVSSAMMSTGNLMYTIGGSIVGLADHVNILQSAGKAVNNGFAAVGNVFLKSPFAALVAVFVVGGVLMGAMRGRSVARRLVSTTIVLGLMVAMVTGASAGASNGSKVGAAGCASVNDFGVMSPAWMANLTSTATCAVTQGFGSSLDSVAESMTAGDDTFLSQGTCAAYVDRLVDLAKEKNKPSQTELQINSSWMNSGLAAWAQTQYGTTPRSDSDDGDSSKAPLASDAWCHQADVNTGRKAANQILLTYGTKDMAKKVGAFADGKYTSRAPAWVLNADDKDDDRALVSWAACKWNSDGTPEVRKGFTKDASGKDIQPSDCAEVISSKDADLGVFDYPGSTGDITKAFSKDETSAADYKADVDYLTSLHGNNLVANGSGPMFGYLISAFAFSIVFILLGCVVLIAKLASGIMTLGLIAVLIKCLISPSSGFDPLVKFGKQFISFSVLAAASGLLLALVSIVTKIVQNVGVDAVGGAGSVFGLVWVGISPLLAVIMLHLMFKQLRVPSPFTPNGVMGYAAAAGGGAIAGAGLVNRLQSRAAGAPGRAGRAGMGMASRTGATGAVGAGGVAGGAGALGLGAKGRSGRMTPLGTAGAAGGIGAAGAAGAAALGVAKGKRGLSGKAAAVSGIETPGATGLLGPAGTAGDRAQYAVTNGITTVGQKALAGFQGIGSSFSSAVGAAKGAPKRIALAKQSAVAAVRRTPTAAKGALNSGKGATSKAIGFARTNYRNPEFWKGAGSAALQASKKGAAATGRGLAQGAKVAPGITARYVVDGTVGAARGLSAVQAATRPGRRALAGAAAGALTGDVRNVARGAKAGAKAGLHINGVQKAKRTELAHAKIQSGREAAQAQHAAQQAQLAKQAPQAPALPEAPARTGLDAAAHARSIAEGKVQAAKQRLAENSAGATVADWKSMKAEQDAAEAHRANMDAAHQRELAAHQAAQMAHQQAAAPAAEAHAAAQEAHQKQVAELDAQRDSRLQKLDTIGAAKNVARQAARAERADVKQARALAAAERKNQPSLTE